jgi:3-oxoacyl-(acyl-carrier-protein) synthase
LSPLLLPRRELHLKSSNQKCLNFLFSDKAGRSIPAPGRGVLTIARELTPKTPLPILDIKYRTRQLAFRRKQISQWAENERELLEAETEGVEGEAAKELISTRLAHIEEEAHRQEKDALATYGMLQGADPRIAPLRRALAIWGLKADDIGVISIHGTSTKANVSCLNSNSSNTD